MGWSEVRVRRFSTGSGHYVFEASGEDGPPIVIRMGLPTQRAEMAHGIQLDERLARLGVPLPTLIASGLEGAFPWVAMERFAGTDLGDVMHGLADHQLADIAMAVASAQTATLAFGSEGRYGYSATAATAPHARWDQVVDASVARSRQRILTAGLFDPALADAAAAAVDAWRAPLQAQPARPFLHDTTTRNVIVTADGRFSGIVDVDDLCFGDPRWAPGLTMAALIAHRGPVAYVDHWLRAAGHADDGLFRLYVAVFLLDLMAEHGLYFNGNETPSQPEDRQRMRAAFEAALGDARLIR